MRRVSLFLVTLLAWGSLPAADNNNAVLADAMRAGRADEVRAYFDAHPVELDAYMWNGMPAITFAVAALKPDIVLLLLDRGANPNALNSTRDFSPLHGAVSVDSAAMIDLLLAHKANIEVENRSGITPLGEALIHGKKEAIRSLLAHGARCDTSSNNRMSAIFMANFLAWPSEQDQVDTITRLLACGADINAKTDIGETAIWPALRAKRARVVELLVSRGISVTDRVRNGRTPLHEAAADAMDAEVLKAMIEKGADPKARDADGLTPFLTAVISGNRRGVEFLLSRGASVNDADVRGRTALHLAASNRPGSGSVVELLIAQGADVNAKMPPDDLPAMSQAGSNTPLHLAAMSGDSSATGVLLEHGARVDALNTLDETPLRLAVTYEHFDVAEELLRHGADIDAQTDRKQSALLLAVLSQKPAAVEFLLKHHANPNLQRIDRDGTPLHLAARNGDTEIVAKLLRYGADTNAKDLSGFTPGDVATDPAVIALLKPKSAVDAAVDVANASRKVCALVVEKANGEKLSDLRAQDVEGGNLRFSPRNDWESDNLRWADTLRTFSVDGRKYLLGVAEEMIHYVASVSPDNVVEVACELQQDDPHERIVEQADPKVCEAALNGGLDYVVYDHLHAASPRTLEKQGLSWGYPGEKAARVDLDNDGRPDYVIELTETPRGCDRISLGILNPARTSLDAERNGFASHLDVPCGAKPSPALLDGVAYVDVDAAATGADRHHQVWKIERDRVWQVCDIAVGTTYRVAEPAGKTR